MSDDASDRNPGALRLVAGGRAGELDVDRVLALLERSTDVETIRGIKDAASAASTYLQARGASVEAINRLQVVVLTAQRKLGEFLSQAELHRGGRPSSKKPVEALDRFSLDEIGVSKDESSTCQRLARIPPERFNAHLAHVQAAGEKLTTAGALAIARSAFVSRQSTNAAEEPDEYYTPANIVELARKVLGEIDLDPASCELAQKTVRAKHFYTKSDGARGGLSHVWRGNVFLNPPFSQPLAKDFARALVDHYGAGRVPHAIMIQNAATETDWFHSVASRGLVCFPSGRINFYTAKGKTSANRVGQVVFYLGGREKLFERTFGSIGLVGKLRGRLRLEGP